MDSKQTLTDSLTPHFLNFAGKLSVIVTAGVKGASFFGLAQANEVFTFIISGITIIYLSFKALNEINDWLDRRKKRKNG